MVTKGRKLGEIMHVVKLATTRRKNMDSEHSIDDMEMVENIHSNMFCSDYGIMNSHQKERL